MHWGKDVCGEFSRLLTGEKGCRCHASLDYAVCNPGLAGKETVALLAEFVAQILKQRCLINFLGNVEVPLFLFLVKGITYCILGFHCHAWKFTHPLSQNEDPFRTN